MATVYLARCIDPSGERLVALKRVREPKARREGAFDILAREAKLASRVTHPNVVATLEVERVRGMRVLVLEYVDGVCLRELMSRGPMPPRVVARIVHDACKGLGAIHAACDANGNPLDVVHRDVSPENILVGIDGVTRIADFGIAVSKGCSRQTLRTARRGKPAYMAPEYLHDGIATPGTDLYSLAVVAWEALTGEPLFHDTDTIESTLSVRRQMVLAPSALADGVPGGWDALLLRALGCTSAPRFADADALECAIVQASASEIGAQAEVARYAARAAAAPPPVEDLHVSLTRPGIPSAKRLAKTG